MFRLLLCCRCVVMKYMFCCTPLFLMMNNRGPAVMVLLLGYKKATQHTSSGLVYTGLIISTKSLKYLSLFFPFPHFLWRLIQCSISTGLSQKRVPCQHWRQRRLLLLSKACVRYGEAERGGEVFPSQLFQVRLLWHHTTTVFVCLWCGGW